MTGIRILFIDDEPDIREIIALSLGLDLGLIGRGCGSGQEGIAAAAEDVPDVILLDVMMPGMDGPTTLAALRENPRTADIPVIFMTARAQSREVEQLKSLGVVAVIAKPFNPMTLAALVRHHVRLPANELAVPRTAFLKRLSRDADLLFQYRSALASRMPHAVLFQIRDIAHGLAGTAGLFGFQDISSTAANLADAVAAALPGLEEPHAVERALDNLLRCIEPNIPDVADERPEMTASVVLDRAMLDGLTENFGSDRMRALLAKFEAQLETSLAPDSDKVLDRTALVAEAHRMISTAGALGFRALSEISRELEIACIEAEDRFAVLRDTLTRAGQVKVSTKQEIGDALTRLACAS